MTKKIPLVLSAFDTRVLNASENFDLSKEIKHNKKVHEEEQRKRKNGKGGRPTEIQGGKRVNVYLDETSLIKAAKIGDGNVSAGIRFALNYSEENKQ